MTLYAHDLTKQRTKDVQIEENVSFQSMLVSEFILKGLHKAGYKRPSPIQLSALPLGRCGLDMIVQAKSGTGKTLVFGLLALESLDMAIKRTQVIIVAPTREIAVQIADVIETVGQFCKGVKVGVVIGGTRMETNSRDLQKYQIIVGAPGRIRHLIEMSILDSKAVRMLVLDEADKLMEDVFLKDINFIFNKSAESKQIIACSATYTPELVTFVKTYMRKGIHVSPSGGPSPILLGLKQFVYITKFHCNKMARQTRKQEALFRIISTVQFDQCLVFCNYVVYVETLCGILKKQGWGAACLTSKQTQDERLQALAQLKEHKARILVTTDLAARGIDASAVNLVVNMGVPYTPETYLHRIGRSGRFGNKGLSVTILSKGEDVKNFQILIGKISLDMPVNIVSDHTQADLWNCNEFETLKGFFETPELERKDNIDEAKINIADNTVPLELEEDKLDDSLKNVQTTVEDIEVVDDGENTNIENRSWISNYNDGCNDSSSSGIGVSASVTPRSGEIESITEDMKNIHIRTRTWKSKYLPSDDEDTNEISYATKDISAMQIDDNRPTFPPFSNHQPFNNNLGPWRLGHEHLWKNGRPQRHLPVFPRVGQWTTGINNYRFPPYPNMYHEPSLRYQPPSRNCNYHRPGTPWMRQNYWMKSLGNQIDNYVQYSRKFQP